LAPLSGIKLHSGMMREDENEYEDEENADEKDYEDENSS
jgi:hypothetical protein